MMSTRKLYLALVLFSQVWEPKATFSQASFAFQNLVPSLGLDAPVFDAIGNALVGPDYLAILYGGPMPGGLQPATGSSGLPMDPVPFTYTPGGHAGYFKNPAGFVLIETVPCGGVPWLQVRAWDARLGTSYEQVVSLGLGGYGQSVLFQTQGGFYCGGVPGPAATLIGLQSFSLLPVVPEPSAAWLLLLGLPLFLRRCRTCKS